MLSLVAEDAAKSDKLVWDVAKDFHGTPPDLKQLDIWDRYAQVLLETNELLFLD